MSEPWYDLLVQGEKVVEGRLGKPEFRALKPGDKITFWNENKEHTFTIIGSRLYSSFKEMLIMEGLSRVLPGIPTLSEGVAIYHQYFTPEDEETYGVIAIELY